MISFKHTRITRYCESQNESMECVYVCPTWCFSFFVRLWQNKWLSCNAFLHCFCQSSKLWIIPSYFPFLVSPQCTIRFEHRLSVLLNWLKLLIFSHFFILRSTLQFIKTIFFFEKCTRNDKYFEPGRRKAQQKWTHSIYPKEYHHYVITTTVPLYNCTLTTEQYRQKVTRKNCYNFFKQQNAKY